MHLHHIKMLKTKKFDKDQASFLNSKKNTEAANDNTIEIMDLVDKKDCSCCDLTPYIALVAL